MTSAEDMFATIATEDDTFVWLSQVDNTLSTLVSSGSVSRVLQPGLLYVNQLA